MTTTMKKLMNAKTMRILAVIMAVLLLALPTLAQNSGAGSVTATVNRTTLTTDDTLTLTISVSNINGNLQGLNLPDIDGFVNRGSSTQMQTSIINGVTSITQNFVFYLQPTKTGTLQIPPFSLQIDQDVYNTDPIEITVIQGNGAPTMPDGSQAPSSTNNGRYIVEATVSDETPYVDEQVTYTARIYEQESDFNDSFGFSGSDPFADIDAIMNQMGMGGSLGGSLGSSFGGFPNSFSSMFNQPELSMPEFNGFWTGEEAARDSYRAQAQDGTTYRVTEITMPLFPTSAGEMVIDPAVVYIGGDIMNAGTTLQSDPITLNVQALPDGAPLDFSGAVGDYTLQSSVDMTETTVGEPVTQTIAIVGEGNIELLPEINWKENPAWRSYDGRSRTEASTTDGIVQGYKALERVFLPREAGDSVTLPQATFTYFNPESEEYVTLTSDPVTVAVAEGEFEAAYEVIEPQANAELGAGLADIKRLEGELIIAPEPVTEQVSYWTLWLLPVALLVGSFAWSWRDRYLYDNRDSIRRSRAFRQAIRDLKRAKRADDVHARVNDIVVKYLSDRLGLPVAGMTHDELANTLQKHSVSAEVAQAVAGRLSASEYNRFAHFETQTDADLLSHTRDLIGTVEEELS